MDKIKEKKNLIIFIAIILVDIVAFGVPSFVNPLKTFAPGSFTFFIGVIVGSYYHYIHKPKKIAK